MTPEDLAILAVPCACHPDFTQRGRHESTYQGGNCDDVREIVERALAAERERCAKVADGWLTGDEVTGRDGMRELAEKIRDGK